jgi:hypothetical protein
MRESHPVWLAIGAALAAVGGAIVGGFVVIASTERKFSLWHHGWFVAGFAVMCLGLVVLIGVAVDAYALHRRDRLAQEAFAETKPAFPRAEFRLVYFAVKKPVTLEDGLNRIQVQVQGEMTNREKSGMSLSFGLKVPLKDGEFVVFFPSRQEGTQLPINVPGESSSPYLDLVFNYTGAEDETATERFEWDGKKKMRWLHVVDHVSKQEVELPIPGRFET